MSRNRLDRVMSVGAATIAVLGLGLGACSSRAKKTTAPTTTAPRATTTTSTAPASGSGNTTNPVAVGLNRSLLSAPDVQQAMSLPAAPTAEPPGASATPQGPLTEQAILSVLPNPAVYKPLYDGSGGGVGANATYHVASPKIDVDVLAIKFATQQGGESFVRQATNIATSLAQGKTTPHPELALGVLPAADQAVLRVPPGPLTGSQETVATDILYSDGVFYLVTLMAPTGVITDAQVIGLARAQAAKFDTARQTIDAPGTSSG